MDRAVTKQAELECLGGGLLEALGIEVLGETQNAERLSDDLPGMAFVRQLTLQNLVVAAPTRSARSNKASIPSAR